MNLPLVGLSVAFAQKEIKIIKYIIKKVVKR